MLRILRKCRTVSAKFESPYYSVTYEHYQKVPTVSAQLPIEPDTLVNYLSYGMFKMRVDVEAETKRVFYERACIQDNWSVRVLKRQISSLYYERAALSHDEAKLAKLTQEGIDKAPPTFDVRDPYVFEFLGLKSQEVMSESHLEAH